MNKKEILKLRPKYKFGELITMIDYFEIKEGAGFFYIRNGLRYADGKTKSPYYYQDFVSGKNAEKIAIDNFNNWWAYLTIKKNKNKLC